MQNKIEKTVFYICLAEVLLGGGAFCLVWKFPGGAPLFLLVFLVSVLGTTMLGFRRVRNQVNHVMELVDDTIEQLILHHECSHFPENEDSLLGKFQSQIIKLHQILLSYEERERLRREQMEQSISDLVHQINTPISNLKIYAEFLNQPDLGEEERILFGKNILSQARKLEWLGEGFGKLSRLEQGIIQLHPAMQPVIGPLLSAIDEVMPKALQNGNEIQLQADQHLEAWMDPKWTEEVFFNLLDNGTKYSSPGTPILIQVEKYEMHVKISVTTQGNLPGKEEIPRLFQRFYRGASSQGREGVGLGLYLVREIVRQQNGYLKTSLHPPGSLTFSVFLRNEPVTDRTGGAKDDTYFTH